MECATRVLGHYGVANFLADVERNREFWRDGSSFCHSALEWASTIGFAAMCRELAGGDAKLEFSTAQQFRQRHLIDAIKALSGKG